MKPIVLRVASSTLGVAALLLLLWFGVKSDHLDELGNLSRLTVFGVVTLIVCSYAVRFARWELYLRSMKIHVPLPYSALVFAAGLSMTLSPAKTGELIKSVLLRRHVGIAFERSAPIVIAERLTDAAGVALLAVAGIAIDRSDAPVVPIVVVLAGIVLALVVLRLPAGRLGRVGRLLRGARQLQTPRLLVPATVLAAISWFGECLAMFVLARGLHADVTLQAAVAVFALATLAGAVSFIPGGLGVADAGMAVLLVQMAGLPADAAVSLTVATRLATLWFGVALGGLALLIAWQLPRQHGARYGDDQTGTLSPSNGGSFARRRRPPGP